MPPPPPPSSSCTQDRWSEFARAAFGAARGCGTRAAGGGEVSVCQVQRTPKCDRFRHARLSGRSAGLRRLEAVIPYPPLSPSHHTHTRAHGQKNILRRFDSLCAWLAYRPSALRRGLLRAARAGGQRRQVRRSTRDCGAALSLVEPGCVCSATETRLKVGSSDLGFSPAPCTMRGCNGSPKKIMVALDNMLPVSSQMGN